MPTANLLLGKRYTQYPGPLHVICQVGVVVFDCMKARLGKLNKETAPSQVELMLFA